MSFENLGLIEPLQEAVEAAGYETPSKIQRQAIPPCIEGRDVLGCAQTGTGKTAAFALPILQRLHENPLSPEQRRAKPKRRRRSPRGRKHEADPDRPVRALVITPTRELAAQIGESFDTYGKFLPLRNAVIYGGVRQGPQVKAMRAGVDILVATPGRLLDLMGQGVVHLDHVEILVLDEADRMLDMGFIDDVRKIINACPDKRQSLLFSATMPPAIQHLADSILNDPVEIRVAPEAPAAESVEQHLYFVERRDKRKLLTHLLSENDEMDRVLVFTRTKREADRVEMHLVDDGVRAEAIHSDKPQKQRERILREFKQGKIRVLVASDIAARGIDVEDVSHVVNFDLPVEAEMYVHRIGRTGRAGKGGVALSFCDMGERLHLEDIHKFIGKKIPVVTGHPHASPVPPPSAARREERQLQGRRRPHRRRMVARRR